ncbi:MAG: hypothetical protein CXT67_00395 [Methanobacteriota archaeon]|nr:MAG: hypothetical protein CXT67_00395 [Euryarchaeota archaeon]
MSRDVGDTNEMKMTGLILSQSALVGLAIGVYSSGLWMPAGSSASSTIDGMTYAMGALAVQTIAYYLFKMFFEQSMKEKVEVAELQRNRQNMYRQQQMGFDQRRVDLELRQMELQLENELRMMHEDPNRVLDNNFNSGAVSAGVQGDYHNTFNPGLVPVHGAKNEVPMNLGLTSTQEAVDSMAHSNLPPRSLPIPPRDGQPTTQRLKKDGTPDLRYRAS